MAPDRLVARSAGMDRRGSRLLLGSRKVLGAPDVDQVRDPE